MGMVGGAAAELRRAGKPLRAARPAHPTERGLDRHGPIHDRHFLCRRRMQTGCQPPYAIDPAVAGRSASGSRIAA
jgi:hypothetical protein